jgi:hypothetical protein
MMHLLLDDAKRRHTSHRPLQRRCPPQSVPDGQWRPLPSVSLYQVKTLALLPFARTFTADHPARALVGRRYQA